MRNLQVELKYRLCVDFRNILFTWAWKTVLQIEFVTMKFFELIAWDEVEVMIYFNGLCKAIDASASRMLRALRSMAFL